jgi:hypothetical protein
MAEDKNAEPTQEVGKPNAEHNKPQQNTNSGLSELLEVAKPIAELFMAYKAQESEAQMKIADARIKYFQQASKHNRNVLYAMTAFLIGVIAFMSFLTWMGKVSGDALLFLVGTVVGYLILFIQRLAHPTDEHPIEEAE